MIEYNVKKLTNVLLCNYLIGKQIRIKGLDTSEGTVTDIQMTSCKCSGHYISDEIGYKISIIPKHGYKKDVFYISDWNIIELLDEKNPVGKIDYESAWLTLKSQLNRTKETGFREKTSYALHMMESIEQELNDELQDKV